MKYQSLFFFFAFLVAIAGCTSKYKVISNQTTASTITLGLQYTGSDEYYVKSTSPIIKNLKFVFHAHSIEDFYFKITDADKQRFEVPQEGVFPIDPLRNSNYSINISEFKFEYTASPFDFKITRRFNNATLFSTEGGEIIFSDYYLQITTQVDTTYNYGLGERFNPNFRLNDGKWTIFNRDRGQVVDKGQGLQTYGYYPIYLQREEHANFFHISYLRSSNAMDVIKETKNGKVYFTYKVIGGVLDFRFFLGINAELTIEKLHIYLGRSEIPPFWSLGFHQCRWGYKNVSLLEYVTRSYESNKIPLDTIWSDIDYMIDYEDFTINEELFPLDRMKNITNKYHYIPIIDAGIKVNDGVAYKEGKARGVFVKDANGSELLGKVWPGTTTFVDFFHPNATTYWKEMLDLLYKKVQFSGIWLDMNEYANFCDGPCDPPSGPSNFDYSRDLPYQPGADGIESHTISLNATHYGGLKEADVHAFGAFLETYATNEFLKSKNLRPFIITRSSTLGSNKYGFHWTGDNYAAFEYLKSSIADNFINQLWGFQMVGPDICGFGGNTTEELCSRWFQLGSLYTFARNHNELNAIGQEPFALGATVLKAAQVNIKLRYSLLKHYYSLFINRKGLGTIFNPLFFIFPLDTNNYNDDIADTQFLIGNNLMSAPILEQGDTSRRVYFTSAIWIDFYTGKEYHPGFSNIFNVQLTDPVPLFLREGTLILTQNTDNVQSTKDLGNVFTLVGGFHLDTRRSNSTHKIYESTGVHISLDDYNNDKKIDSCIAHGCDYVFNTVLTTTENTRVLSLTVNYGGDATLIGLLIIDNIVTMFDGHRVETKLTTPIQIRGPLKIEIPINNDSIEKEHHHQHLRPEII